MLAIRNKHGNELLKLLQQNPAGVSLKTLEERMNLSRRSIFYTIKAVNLSLAENQLDEIEHIHELGYVLPQETARALQQLQTQEKRATSFTDFLANPWCSSSVNKIERQLLMRWLLVSRSTTSINQFSRFFRISRNTAIHDLAAIERNLPKGIVLKNSPLGKTMLGDEVNKRRWVFANFNQLFELVHDQLSFSDDKRIDQQLHLLEKITGNTLVDEAFHSLVLYIKWVLERIKTFPQYQLKEPVAEPETLAFTWANSFLHDFGVDLPAEAKFLAEIINTQAFQHVNQENPLVKKLYPITVRMIERFNEISGAELQVTEGTLVQNLSVHMVSTYYRCMYGIKYHNPLLKQIQTDYRESFELTRKAVEPFITFTGKPLSDDEIALITVYFSGAIRNLDLPTNSHGGVMVICSNGIGTSQLLISQLRSHYPMVEFIGPYNTFQYENVSLNNVRLVISTVKLPQRLSTTRPMITVPVMPTTTDWQQIGTWLKRTGAIPEYASQTNTKIDINSLIDVMSSYVRIVDYQGLEKALKEYVEQVTPTANPIVPTAFDNSFATYVDRAVEWKNATWLAMDPLIKNGSIEPRYTSRIIQLTEEHGDYMAIGKGIFLAHAAPSAGVNQLGFTYTFFKEPFRITGSKKELNLIIGLAPIDPKQHLKVLGTLMHYIQDDQWIEQLHQVRSQAQLEELLVHSHLIN